MKKLAFITMTMGLLATGAFALDLQAARSQGLVGEKQDGYIAGIGGGPEVKGLVGEVNSARKAEYSRIAAQNGQTVDVVAKVASGPIINGLPKGAKYQDASGNWVVK